MAIAPGEKPSSDEVLNQAGIADAGYNSEIRVAGYCFQTEAQIRYAQEYDGDVTPFNTLHADDWVAGFEVFSSSGDYDSGNSTAYYNDKTGLVFADLYDDFGDASLDATLWTNTGSVTEASGYAELSGAATLTSDGSGSNFNGKTADSTFIMNWSCSFDASTRKVQITDGSNTVDVLNQANGYWDTSGHTNGNSMIELYFDVSAETVTFRTKARTETSLKTEDWSAWSSTIDISSVTGEWNVRISSTAATVRIYDTWFVQGAATKTFQSNGYDHLQTATDPSGVITLDHGLFTVNRDFNGATPTWSISSDDGSNFTSLNENEITPIGNASNQLVLKASVQTTADRPAYIYEFGVKAWD